jgi:hypothetical protein
MDGLTVRNGRLINNRPDGMTGIQEAAMLCKARKREEKIEMMAEAFKRGEMMSERYEMEEQPMSKMALVRRMR